MKLKQIKTVQFSELTHRYICKDKLLVGVTTLMKNQGLSPDYGGIPEKVLANAAKRGTSIHNLMEAYDNGQTPLPCDVRSDFDGSLLQSMAEQARALTSYKSLCLPVLCSEYLVSDCETVASFIDKVLSTENENEVDLADIKTSSELHLEPLSWQLSIYAYLFEKMNPKIKVRNLYGIHILQGVAKKVQVERKSNKDVKAVIEAEKKGEKVALEMPEAPKVSLPSILGEEQALVLAESLTLIKNTKEALKQYEEQIALVMGEVKNYMEQNGLAALEVGDVTICYKKPYQTSRVDTKKLKENYPEIYEKVIKTSEVAGSITFK